MENNNLIKFISILCLTGFMIGSCTDWNPLPEDDPSNITDAPYLNLLTGIESLNLEIQRGDLAVYSNFFTRQIYAGRGSFKDATFEYMYLEEYDQEYRNLYKLMANRKVLKEKAVDDIVVMAIANVMEADAARCIANLYGDIAYFEAVADDKLISPKLDSQIAVYNEVLKLLDEAILIFEQILGASVEVSTNLDKDIFYRGNTVQWLEATNSLKARTYLEMKMYPEALIAAEKGISTSLNDLQYTILYPDLDDTDAKSYFYREYTRRSARQINHEDSFLATLLDERENAKTNEEVRSTYYELFNSTEDISSGRNIGAFDEPLDLITYHETLLIIAECAVRAGDLDKGLNNLNKLRTDLMTGKRVHGFLTFRGARVVLPIIKDGEEKLYNDYEIVDFEPGGMENSDNIPVDRALLREIIEERYVSLYTSMMAFNDARRLRKTDADIAVDFLRDAPADALDLLERIPYPNIAAENNTNIPFQIGPAHPSIFEPTEINR